MDVRLQQQVREAAEAVGSNVAGWESLLTAWCRAAGADFATFQVWDKVGRRLLNHVSAGLLQLSLQQTYINHFQAFDPLLPIGLQRQAGDWVDSAADLPAGAWRSGAYYAELMRPLRIEQTVSLCLCNDARYIASISLHRSRESDASACKQALEPLRLVLPEAFARRLQQADAECDLLDAVLSSEREGWLLIDASLRVRHACATARHLLGGVQAMQLRDDSLQPRQEALAQRLRAAVRAVHRGQPPQTLHCAAAWGCVLQLRLQRATRHLTAFGEALLLVRVRRHDAASLPDTDALRAVYALTQAEARLVREIAAGHTLDDCAVLFGVSRNTLRNQMAGIFVKMGCSRQIEVGRLAGLLV